MTTLTLKPADGARVRHPDGTVLDPAGATVADNTYWRRRIADRDVTLTTTPKTKA